MGASLESCCDSSPYTADMESKKPRVGSSRRPIHVLLDFQQMQIFQCFSPISNIKLITFSESVISVFLSQASPR